MLKIGRNSIFKPFQVRSVLTAYFKLAYNATAYATWDVIEDTTLATSDLFVPVCLGRGPRPFDDAYEELFTGEKKGMIEKVLAKIPVDEDIETADLSMDGLGQAIEELLNITTRVKGIQIPVATRILHKKRPRLIPVLDEAVLKHYWKKAKTDFHPVTVRRTRKEATLNLFDRMKQDIVNNKSILEEGVRLFAKQNRPERKITQSLTPLRTLDIIIWCGIKDPRKYYRGI